MDNLNQAIEYNLITIEEMGLKRVNSIVTFFKNEEVKDIIQRLKDYGINMNYLGKELANIDNVDSIKEVALKLIIDENNKKKTRHGCFFYIVNPLYILQEENGYMEICLGIRGEI